jgi:TatD DNase family protein
MLGKGLDPVAELQTSRDTGMAELVDIGLHPDDLAKRRKILRGVHGILYSSGFAPAQAATDEWRTRLHTLAKQAAEDGISAIGELGLDWYRGHGTKESQMALMEAQLDIAKTAHLPVIIHNREADREVYDLLKRANLPEAGIMHCFSSNFEMAAKCIDLGFCVSFAGNVTYKNAQDIQDAARRVPDSSLLLETDAPFLSPQAVRGRVNSPRHIVHTYEFVANLRGTALEELTATVRGNLQRIINSTRRFDALPSSVSFDPTGSVPPRPS